MEHENEMGWDDFHMSEDEMMTPLIDWAMNEEAKPSNPNEKSNLVSKRAIIIEETVSQSSDVTDIIGKTGIWQIKILILLMLTGLPAAWNHLGMSFLAYPVDHWCARPSASNISLEYWFKSFLPNTTIKGKVHHSQCSMYLYNKTTNTAIRSKIVPCDVYDYTSDFNSILIEWNIVCNNDWLLSTSQTVYMIGFLMAVLISGHFADKFGRHPAIMINIVIMIIAGFAVAFSNTFFMFAISRFFVAFGHGGVGLVGFILLIECVGSKYRVLYMMLHGVGWHAGYLVLPLLAWLQPDWFLLQIIITAPSIFFLSYYWLLPESSRWLLANGKVNDALPILKDAVKMNGKDAQDLENQAKLIAKLNFKEEEQPSMTTFVDLLRTPNLRMKTLSLYFIWAVIAFTYYGLSLNTNDLDGNLYFNFFLSGFMEIPATVMVLVTLNRFGRKKPFFISLMLGGLACFACIFIPIRFSLVKTGLAMVGKMFVSGSFAIAYIFSAEIFPTVARNVGVGSSSTVARIGSAIAPFMRDLGNVTNPSVPLVIFGVLSIFSALIVLKLPETNNQPIPESMDQAEKFGQKEPVT